MKKLKAPPAPDTHRWLVSYADFITLMFAFFVVMYAISSVNDDKYRTLASGLEKAFNHDKPVEEVHSTKSPQKTIGKKKYAAPGKSDTAPVNSKSSTKTKDDKSKKSFDKLVAELSNTSDFALDPNLILIQKKKDWFEMHIEGRSLFEPGSANPTRKAVAFVQKLAAKLKTIKYPVSIEAHTDNRRVDNMNFPSNWELSAVRAATVVRMLADAGVKDGRMMAIGYGSQYPVASNLSPEGRAKNRRITIVISRSDAVVRILKPKQFFPVNNKKPLDNDIKVLRTDEGGLKFTRDKVQQ